MSCGEGRCGIAGPISGGNSLIQFGEACLDVVDEAGKLRSDVIQMREVHAKRGHQVRLRMLEEVD